MKYSNILSNGKYVSGSQLKRTQELAEDNLCSIESIEYVICANAQDHDFEQTINKKCDGHIYKNSSNCPECGRNIYGYDRKEKFYKKKVNLNLSGIRDYVRENIKSYFGTTGRTIDRTYCGISKPTVLEFDSLPRKVFILSSSRGEDYIKWCRVYDEDPVVLLIGGGRGMEQEFSKWNIPHFIIDDFYPEIENSVAETMETRSSKLKYRRLRADAASELTGEKSTLSQMKYDDFENCVQALLVGILGNSQLLGSNISGKGVPDGVFNLHFNHDGHLYMWDAKFVKYNIDNGSGKTDLKGESLLPERVERAPPERHEKVTFCIIWRSVSAATAE